MRWLRFAACLSALSGPAWAADTTIYYHAGAWDAFSGRSDGGHMFCGIGSTNPADGRALSLRFDIGGANVVFEARKPGWSIPNGTNVPVVMTIGTDTPWSQQAVAENNALRWTLDGTAIQTFDAQFRRAGSMTVAFPGGNEPPWTLSLTGSTAISNAFGRCVRDLAARGETAPPGAPTQPFTPAPAPTQPVR